MSAAFTPGPWEWWDDGKSLVRITDAAEQKLVARAALPSNARLIAAAPKMYEALEDLIELARPNVYPQPDKPESPYGRLERARLILAKARGDQ